MKLKAIITAVVLLGVTTAASIARSDDTLKFSERGESEFGAWTVRRHTSMLNDSVTHIASSTGKLHSGQSKSGTTALMVVPCNRGNWGKIAIAFEHLNVGFNLEKGWSGEYYKSARFAFRLDWGRAYGQEVVVDLGKDSATFYSNSEGTQRRHVRRFEGLSTIHMGIYQYRGTQWYEFAMDGYDAAISELRYRCNVK